MSKEEFKDYGFMVRVGNDYVPLGKIESVETLTGDSEIPDETLGMDMTGFKISDSMTLTATLNIENPLKLKMQLLGIPVVNVIMCKNCANRYTTRCPSWRSNFGDDDTCSKGVLKCQTE